MSTQYPPCSEGPKTKQRTWEGVLTVSSITMQSFPAGYIIPDAGQDALAFLAKSAHCWIMFSQLADQIAQVIFYQTTFNPLSSKPILLYKVVMTQVKGPTLSLVEYYMSGHYPLVQTIQIPLQAICRSVLLNLVSSINILGGAPDAFVQISDKNVKHLSVKNKQNVKQLIVNPGIHHWWQSSCHRRSVSEAGPRI